LLLRQRKRKTNSKTMRKKSLQILSRLHHSLDKVGIESENLLTIFFSGWGLWYKNLSGIIKRSMSGRREKKKAGVKS